MRMIAVRPAEPARDFGQLAAWFSILEDETTTEVGLQEYYEKQKARIVQRVVYAVESDADYGGGELLGFYWAALDKLQPQLATVFLYVRTEQRGKGIGSLLYEDLLRVMHAARVRKLRVSVSGACPQDRTFAEHRGFVERARSMAMALDLDAFDDRPYDAIIARLQGEGFRFTSMAALGNTEEDQRRLYVLNETTGMETMGTDGVPSWASFEDFQQSVCRSDWYRPDGQMVVIASTTGDWAAMSAIARFDDYAYNLHTGVDKRYRGRKLAQAVKVLALRYARDELKVNIVRTHHNSKNLPMIAIDRKFGYVQMSETLSMEKSV